MRAFVSQIQYQQQSEYMPQIMRKHKASPILTSPDGVKIQITQGRKMKFISHANSSLSHLEGKVMAVLIDKTNEGSKCDPSRYGLAWPSVKTMMEKTRGSLSGVKKVLKKLQEAGLIRITNADSEGKNRGGRSKVNEYWLPGWNVFGLVSDDDEKGALGDLLGSEKSALNDDKTGHSVAETGHSVPTNRSLSDPDSTHLLASEPNSKEIQRAVGALTGDDMDGKQAGAVTDDRPAPQPANDNNAWPVDAFDRFWGLYLNKVDKKKAKESFDRLARSGKVDYRFFMKSAKAYSDLKRGTNANFFLSPVTFIGGRYEDDWEEKIAMQRKAQRSHAI